MQLIGRIQRKRKRLNVPLLLRIPSTTDSIVFRANGEIFATGVMIRMGSISLLSDIAVDEESADQIQKEIVLLRHDPSVFDSSSL